MAGWRGVVEWRQVYRRALLWGAGIDCLPGDRDALLLVQAGYVLDLVEVGYRVRTAWDRGADA